MAGREFDIISKYFRPLTGGAGEALGLMDDAAVLDVPEGQQLVVTTDAVVGGVHFLETLKPQDIAHKVVGVNLSDLAAMGAQPKSVFLAAQFSPTLDDTWLAAFAEGLKDALAPSGAVLLGGDTVTTFGPMAFTITALGHVAQGQALTRSGAEVGDLVFATGSFGDAALGLALWQGKVMGLSREHEDYLTDRYARPQPRWDLGRELAKRGLATACVDVSDGLVADVGHVCQASNVRAVLEYEQIQLSSALEAALDLQPAFSVDVLSGGDDYELVFCAKPSALTDIEELAAIIGVDVNVIGRMESLEAHTPLVEVLDAHGQALDVGDGGYRHL
ncbi:MAG: thiamine-phosphate kinase [Magnetovibrio sp.]|nr:thiamine-phosphate kinase [Magnetovibrio sp.]